MTHGLVWLQGSPCFRPYFQKAQITSKVVRVSDWGAMYGEGYPKGWLIKMERKGRNLKFP